MHTRLLLASSAAFMGILGLVASFAPQEVLVRLGVPPVAVLVVLVQVTGALYLGFAMVNWMSKGIRMGGIYSRPLAMGNLLHFAVVAATLWKAISVLTNPEMIAIAMLYAVFAAWFAATLFTSPVPRRGNGDRP